MNRRGYTLVEIMISTALMLVIMYAVTQAFGTIGESIVNARASLEMAEELRGTASRLKEDLKGVTVKMLPPRSPGSDEGVLEYTEGFKTPPMDLGAGQPDTTVGQLGDTLLCTTRSDGAPFVGRWLNPLTGLQESVQSHVAEVAWFVRGRTLYRRVLLVAPHVAVVPNGVGFYSANDISVRLQNGVVVPNRLSDLTMPENRFAHQSLHYYNGTNQWRVGYPYHPDACVRWAANGTLVGSWPTPWASLGLPTLAECSSTNPSALWIAGGPLRIDNAALPAGPPLPQLTPLPVPADRFDAWTNPHPWQEVSPTTGILRLYHDPDANTLAARVNEDVILNNVLSFDVKAWDPGAPVIERRDTGTGLATVLLPGDPGYTPAPGFGTRIALDAIMQEMMRQRGIQDNLANRALVTSLPVGFAAPGESSNVLYTVVSVGAYVDLGYAASIAPNISPFSSNGANPFLPRVYDTWSTHYEEQALAQGILPNGVNGFDDATLVAPTGDGVVDDPSEWQFPPPYWAPLRGIQIKIRVYEPSSRQIREVTVVQEFVSK